MTYFWSFINYKNKQLPNKNPILDKNDYFFWKTRLFDQKYDLGMYCIEL